MGDVGAMKLNKAELEKRTKLYSAKHMEKIRGEIRDVQSKFLTTIFLIYKMSPFAGSNFREVPEGTPRSVETIFSYTF